ncbi:MAG: FAD:protein FMN transferase [Solirubrobacterales bacterium]
MKRRRFLAITAAAGALAAGPARAFRLDPVEWRGVALGAPATLIIHHEDRDEALRLVRACEAEIARQEAIFSLYRPDSALVRLNRDGALEAPPLDLVTLLALAGRMWELSEGTFDPTVQPLWDVYARHFGQPGASPDGPDAESLAAAKDRLGWPHVSLAADRVALARPGMALTLNGIAQGWITDRVADLLRRAGMRHVLVDMGEIRALGRRGDGMPWTVEDETSHRRLDLQSGAMATSSPDGTRFSPCCHHLFDPATGRSAAAARAVTVLADEAAVADGLATAIAIHPTAGAALCRSLGARTITA